MRRCLNLIGDAGPEGRCSWSFDVQFGAESGVAHGAGKGSACVARGTPPRPPQAGAIHTSVPTGNRS
jgi:hypothetical protein